MVVLCLCQQLGRDSGDNAVVDKAEQSWHRRAAGSSEPGSAFVCAWTQMAPFPRAGSLVQAFLPAPRRGPAVWGWVGAPRLAGVAVVLCSELGGTVFRAGCRWLGVLGAGAARWARAGAVMRWCRMHCVDASGGSATRCGNAVGACSSIPASSMALGPSRARGSMETVITGVTGAPLP